jgi:hypothetical protein
MNEVHPAQGRKIGKNKNMTKRKSSPTLVLGKIFS